MSTGLPVTDAGTECPECIDIVSMIQAITWGLVPMSGAGMSFSGPRRMAISVAYRRVRCSSSLFESFMGSHATAPFEPP